jgi:transcriptional regulator NrdR family protein
LNNSKDSNISKKTSNQENEIEKNIIIRKSTGREENFDTNRLAQTSIRSGIPFTMAKDIANKTAEKVHKSIKNKISNEKISENSTNNNITSDKTASEDKVVVTADQVRNLVAEEIKERNRPEIASSFIGEPTTNNSISNKSFINDTEPMLDNVAANKNRLRFEPGKVHRDERAA